MNENLTFDDDNPPFELLSAVEKITPEMAESWLELNTYNRKKLDSHIERIARDVAEHKFKLNGETIIFANNGRLLDGQNRLEAVVKAKRPIWCLVARNVPPENFDSIGLGRPRTMSDFLQLAGAENAKLLGSALVAAFLLEKYEAIAVAGGLRPTVNELEKFLADNPRLKAEVVRVKAAGKLLMGSALTCALLFLFGKIDVSLANGWLEAVIRNTADNEITISQQPFRVMRDVLVDNLASLKKFGRSTTTKIAILAWNAAIQGDTLSRRALIKKERSFPIIQQRRSEASVGPQPTSDPEPAEVTSA